MTRLCTGGLVDDTTRPDGCPWPYCQAGCPNHQPGLVKPAPETHEASRKELAA